ncbi:insulin receptor substrate 1 isoform X3 [Lucilia cuprina]|uniref:insulin receptor substrate 1 isoform X3 n=1 Tax=Lucilia cuprina TaxID=7375 RepID=UPI001F059BDD|nr:insulin receptor substrate 1 isoform X3 [Lucilia cuprina]
MPYVVHILALHSDKNVLNSREAPTKFVPLSEKMKKMSKQRLSVLNDDGVLLCGYYKKLKTMKKKFFVLYNETPCKVARIEYYDTEKKYKSGFTPKRIIKIKNCFNINRRFYTKHDFVIVLASKEGGFGIVMDSEDEINTWLHHLLHLQRSGETCFDLPNFDYVWQVVIQKKGIAEQHNIFGSYHICLTNKSVTFIKIGREKNVCDKKITRIEVLLTTIRRCGDSQCYFYMEIGRQSSLGPGELWMETEDSLTAQNMHRMILSKMISLNESLIEPMRKRSSSATESSNLSHDRKSSQNVDIANSYLLNAENFSRDRCDSLPSRNRSSSECSNQSIRILPITSTSRAINMHISNTSPITYSASEESVSVEESEESMAMPHLISSRSPEGVIPEEYIDDAVHSEKLVECNDMNSVAALSLGPGCKVNMNHIKQNCSAKVADINKIICGNVDDQSYPCEISKRAKISPAILRKYTNYCHQSGRTDADW